MTPRRLPSNRRRRRGTSSWADEKRERQDADDRRDGRVGAEGQQQRDRQAVAGEGRDGGLADADPEVAPVAPAEEHAPLVDRACRRHSRSVAPAISSRSPVRTRRWRR